MSHQRFPAIIVYDPQSPRYDLYKGMQFFPPDLSYHIVAALTPNPEADTTIILSTRGSRRRAVRVGWFDFKVKGTPCRLEATRLLEPGVGEKEFGLFFTDATTGKETERGALPRCRAAARRPLRTRLQSLLQPGVRLFGALQLSHSAASEQAQGGDPCGRDGRALHALTAAHLARCLI